jgi:hypothetical protein
VNSKNNRISTVIYEVPIDDDDDDDDRLVCGLLQVELGLLGQLSTPNTINLHEYVTHIFIPCLNTCQITREPVPFSSKTAQQLTPQTILFTV